MTTQELITELQERKKSKEGFKALADECEAHSRELVRRIQALKASGGDFRDLLGDLYRLNEFLLAWSVKPYKDVAEEQELIQEAFFPLRRAALSFQADGEVKFSTYLPLIVRRHILRYLEKSGSLGVTIPAYLSARCANYNKTFDELHKSLGRVPTDHEMRAATGYNQRQLNEIKRALSMRKGKIASLDSPAKGIDGDADQSLIDFVPDTANDYETILDSVAAVQRREIWAVISGVLSEREYQILELRYLRGLSCMETGEHLGISGQRVNQIEGRAKQKLLESRGRELADLDADMEAQAYKSSCNGHSGSVERAVIRKLEREAQIVSKTLKRKKR